MADATERFCDDCGTNLPASDLHKVSITFSASPAGATKTSYSGDALSYFSVRGELCHACTAARKATVIALDEAWNGVTP